eukprot:UN22161
MPCWSQKGLQNVTGYYPVHLATKRNSVNAKIQPIKVSIARLTKLIRVHSNLHLPERMSV